MKSVTAFVGSARKHGVTARARGSLDVGRRAPLRPATFAR